MKDWMELVMGVPLLKLGCHFVLFFFIPSMTTCECCDESVEFRPAMLSFILSPLVNSLMQLMKWRNGRLRLSQSR